MRSWSPASPRVPIVGLLCAVLVSLAVPASAFAAAYDGTDPNGTGCAPSGSVYTEHFIGNVDGFGSLLELRWSTKCLTAWGRFTCHASNGCFNFRLSVVRNDGAVESLEVPWPNWMSNGDQLYTLQLNDDYRYTAQACYLDETRGTPSCTASF